MISFARNQHSGIAAESASSFALDNRAFSLWKAGQQRPNWDSYYGWVEAWRNHPGFDFAIILDVIDGREEENDALLAQRPFFDGVPVYHLNESLDRLARLANSYSRKATMVARKCESRLKVERNLCAAHKSGAGHRSAKPY